MKPYIEWTKEELVAEKARLEQEFADVKSKRPQSEYFQRKTCSSPVRSHGRNAYRSLEK
mgnify:FL=1